MDYKENFEEAKRLYETANTDQRYVLEKLFPELAESEDEKIRKALIENFKFFGGEHLETSKWGKNDDLLVTDIIAWLEKQGETFTKRDVDDAYLKGVCDAKQELEKQGEPIEINPTEFDTRLQNLIGQFDSLPKEELLGSLGFWTNVVQNDGIYKDEKQGEQKPIYHKFRVGDEIKTQKEASLTITKIDDNGYWSEDLFICDFDEECIWDLVEQKPVEWSEEDEENLQHSIAAIHTADYYTLEDKNEMENWLKSLKDRIGG